MMIAERVIIAVLQARVQAGSGVSYEAILRA
jgi:hypothetical protein